MPNNNGMHTEEMHQLVNNNNKKFQQGDNDIYQPEDKMYKETEEIRMLMVKVPIRRQD